ncbi:MAG: DJ-1/PfpI family protein [Pyrobaculum sp.]|uniref:DJ-1/PfpI family protein n=1 Tax=Pyrobaculum sp. TaxID=2004705 RepID=UPI003CB82B5D
MPKALIFVIDMAKREEYSVLKNFLTKAGYEVKSAVGSRDVNINYDVDFMTMSADDAAKIADEYDLLGLAGGYKIYYHVLGKKPPLKMWDLNIDLAKLNAVIDKFHREGKTVVAPLAVPGYLAQLGLLRGKEATVYPTTELIKILREGGAKFVNRQVVRSGGVVTAKDITTTSEKEFIEVFRETT